jgi:hypothetical protein
MEHVSELPKVAEADRPYATEVAPADCAGNDRHYMEHLRSEKE